MGIAAISTAFVMSFIQRQLAMSVGVVRSLQVNRVKPVGFPSSLSGLDAIMDNDLNNSHNKNKGNGMQANDLNGWQRIWVIICVLSLTGAISYGCITIPTRSEVIEMHNAQFDPNSTTIKDWERKLASPDPETRELARDSIQKINEFMAHVSESNAKELEGLVTDQAKRVLIIAGVWLGFCISLYATGWLCDWVYRGFRPKKT